MVESSLPKERKASRAPVRMFVGLGSNLGDRAARLRDVVAFLARSPGFRVVSVSSIYETRPVGPVQDQPNFFNAVVEVLTNFTPQEVLTCFKAYETRAGREDGPRWGPRAIDLDILTYGDQQVSERYLQIPHPELKQRAFVLVPFAEIAPECLLPGENEPIACLCANREDLEDVVRVGPFYSMSSSA